MIVLRFEKIMDGFNEAGMKLPTIELVDGGVKVTVWRDNIPSLSQVEQSDNKYFNKILSQVVSQVVSQVKDADLRQVTKVFVSLQEAKSMSELMEEFGPVNRTRFKRTCIDILIRSGLATPTIPDKPNSRFQKYVLTEKGKQLIAGIESKKWFGTVCSVMTVQIKA